MLDKERINEIAKNAAAQGMMEFFNQVESKEKEWPDYSPSMLRAWAAEKSMQSMLETAISVAISECMHEFQKQNP